MVCETVHQEIQCASVHRNEEPMQRLGKIGRTDQYVAKDNWFKVTAITSEVSPEGERAARSAT